MSDQRLAVDASLIEADTNRQNSSSQSEWETGKINPEDAPRAVREYLATLDETAFGAATPVQPKFTSHSDRRLFQRNRPIDESQTSSSDMI